uniref:Uncharacterized protein n=1 Tax=viral metagenome TaxID=1070528 RepID=A0A6C0DRF5_9ZZZZ
MASEWSQQQDRIEQRAAQTKGWNPPLHDPTQINIPMSAAARIRFEPNTRDAINSRIWESIQYDTKSPNTSEIQQSSNPVFFDMNPINSRSSSNNYNQQAQFFPDPPRPASTAGSIPPPAQPPTLEARASSNPYLQRLDAVNDSRNIPREMRGAVNEDNRERDIDASRILAERQFNYRFLPAETAANAAALQAYELLRPKTDDYNKTFRP